MKRLFGVALTLFGATLVLVVNSGAHYCQTRWIALAIAAVAVVFGGATRKKSTGEFGALTFVVIAATVVFDIAFFVIATRHCH